VPNGYNGAFTTAGKLNWGRSTGGLEDVVAFRVIEEGATVGDCETELAKFLDEEKVLPFQRELIKRAWYRAWEKGHGG
jgi:hypothetical protein